MSKKKPEAFILKAAFPLHIVLCRDGRPHPGIEPKLEYDHAARAGVPDVCGPHRVQAYRPMM